MEKGARTGKGRARECGAAWGGRARPSSAYARARQWGVHGSKEGRIYVLPFLIGICQAFSSWLLA
jgi:hypothetical protein